MSFRRENVKIVNGDIIFLRNGTPAVVKNVDKSSGQVVLESEMSKVQQQAENGVKNSLDENQRESYNTNLSKIRDDSKQDEIQNLYELIQSHRQSKQIDPKVLRYLENELMHRMLRDDYTPPNFQVDLKNVPQY